MKGKENSSKSTKKLIKTYTEGDLRLIYRDCRKKKISLYDGLVNAGLIKSSSEFIK